MGNSTFDSLRFKFNNLIYLSLLLHFLFIPKIGASSKLFPYGLNESDATLSRESDDISTEFRLNVPIVFYGKPYNSIYINQNGLVSFQTEIPSFVNIQFPLDYPAIAPLYSDVDIRITGSVYFRESTNVDILERARVLIESHFSSATNFTPTGVLIATWDGVGYFDRKSDKANTFQVIIATDGSESYVLFIYEKIEWIQGTGKNPSLPDAKGQAGLISGRGPHYTLKGSGTDQVSSLYRRSNMGVDGVWGFRVGRVSDTIVEPDLNLGTDETSETSSSCSLGSSECHSQAECNDFSPGFCCKCISGYYGNGKTCLQNGTPQRVVGKVKGVLNGIAIEDADFFSYILPTDGRAYTAVARIPERLGYDMQTVSVLGTIIGWLFSISIKGAPNGFHFTGGSFNYTAEITFQLTGQKVTINQQFNGLDVFNQLKVDTRIHGTTALIPVGKSIDIPDFEMLLTRVRPGVLRSKSSHNFRVQGTSLDNPFSIEQTIVYQECAWSSPVPPELDIIKMKIGRHYFMYDAGEQIVRYATTSKVTPADGDDPCKDNKDKCGPNSSCVANEDSYKCICDPGYEELYHEDEQYNLRAQCVDINECSSGSSICDVTAICINLVGSHQCVCREGYSGTGEFCEKILTCSDVQCGANAHCQEIAIGEPECRCLPGYFFLGDGLTCYKEDGYEIVPGPTPDCRQVPNICDSNAECIYSPSSMAYVCNCKSPRFYGDGISCYPDPRYDVQNTRESCELEIESICHRNAVCQLDEHLRKYVCVCKRGYEGNGYENCDEMENNSNLGLSPEPTCSFADQCKCPTGFEYDDIYRRCIPETAESKNCQSDPSLCDLNAVCAFTPRSDSYSCVCNEGFSGNGHHCLPQNLCTSHSVCHKFGECAYNRTELRYRCKCRDGYFGDGESTCEEDLTGCNVLKNCHRNAECLFDTTESAYRCRCKQGYEGDGSNCRSTTPCYHDRSVCDVNAECGPVQATREWKCQCKTGYVGSGYECRELGRRDTAFLILAKGMSIIKVPLDGNMSEPIIVDPLQISTGVDIDCINEKIYWSDVGGGSIKESYFNGSGAKTFLKQDMSSPEGVSLDWTTKNLYWTDSSKDTIEVANLESKKRKTLISTQLINPRGIAVYPQRGRLFWSDWDRSFPKIEFSGLDGLGRQVLISNGLSLPNSLVVDFATDQLCFADAGIHKIECVGIDGRNRRTFVSDVAYPFGLAMGVDSFFYSDWSTGAIEKASRNTGVRSPNITVSIGGPGKLYGLTLVPFLCPQAYSPCTQDPCGDEKMCLPNIRGGRTCRCINEAGPRCQDDPQ